MKYINTKILELFSKNLEFQMVKKGYSQTTLANLMGQKPGVISRYISGKVEPKISAVARMAEELEIEPYVLLLPDQPKESPTVSTLSKLVESQSKLLDGNERLLEIWSRLDEGHKSVIMDQMIRLVGHAEKSKKAKA